MPVREPINARLLDPINDEIKLYGWLPVTSHQIYEPSSTTFQVDGLYSEVIFGQVGSPKRLETFGYIDLHCRIFQPKIYKTLVSLKAIYADILAGKIYVTFDTELQDFIRCDQEDDGAGTGFTFFLKHFPNIKFQRTSSLQRDDKLKLLEKYKDILLIDKYLVQPAGIRDIRMEADGRTSSEEINKLYNSLLSLSQAMPPHGDSNPIFDALKYNIQVKVVQIYDYVANIVDGKSGFAQRKFGARTVTSGTRNVITSPSIANVRSPQDPKYLHANETLIPLFQVAKMLQLPVLYSLKSNFFDNLFTLESVNSPLIDKETLALTYVEVSDSEKNLYTTEDGLNKLINLFRNDFIRHKPVTIQGMDNKSYYCYLVYDTGDTIYLVQNKDNFADGLSGKQRWSVSNIKHLDLLVNYKLQPSDFVISGSGSLIGHGYLGPNNDLDLVVSIETLERLVRDHGFTKASDNNYRDPTGLIEVSHEHVELSSSYNGTYRYKIEAISFQDLKDSADIVDGYALVNLQVLKKTYTVQYEENGMNKYRNKVAWLKSKVFNPEYLRPLTYAEMFYIAVYKTVMMGTTPKHATVTRYPILNVYGILPTRINIQTTEPNRTVVFKHPIHPELQVVLPRYPILHGKFQDSMSPHTSSLDNYGGDFDGDALSAIGAMSEQANQELEDHFDQPHYMVGSTGNLATGLSACKLGKYMFYMATRNPIRHQK